MTETQLMGKQSDNGPVSVEEIPGEVRISVRNLVEFILREGDIDNRHQGSPDNAMQEGGRIHRMIQRRMGAEYQAEVSLRYTLNTEKYTLIVEGRADGIIDSDGEITVDEIKGTYRDVSKMRTAVPVHVAQAKCYAYIYALQNELKFIRIRMTYCNIETENMRYFYEDYSFEELQRWFEELIAAYRKWADFNWEWKGIRRNSIIGLQFPFPYREGQKDLVTGVYRTIYHGRKLFLQAPTGVGKTISTVFPSVQAMGQGMGDKLFYLTAKTITRTVADEALEILRDKGLRFKSVILTAKEKICFMEKPECNPENCPYAKGHYDRINDAVFDLLTHEDRFTRECIVAYAQKHQVCPFELCLDMSLFSDGIIGDYNYLFDPHVYLKRFFADGNRGDYLFLIDEAHNLLDRGREMYSADLKKDEFLTLKREIKLTLASEMSEKPSKKGFSGQMTLPLTIESSESSELVYDMSEERPEEERKGRSILSRGGYGERIIYFLERCNKILLEMKRDCEGYMILEGIDQFVNPLLRLYNAMGEYLEEQEEVKLPVREQLLEFYFKIKHFLDMYELKDSHYVTYSQVDEEGDFMVKLFCVDPSNNLKSWMRKGRSSILFSATFLPIQYYKSLLGGEEEDYEIYAKSVFNQEKRALFIADDVTSKFARRSEEEYNRIACYIHEIVKQRHGNYMVFCPSYQFMQTVYDIYTTQYATQEQECILQQEYMNEDDRENFLMRFRIPEETAWNDSELRQYINMEIEQEDQSLVAFCVLGGIFSEGIDLKKDSLIGAIIVGAGIPQVCNEREILKQYFDGADANGFDYAYRFPGMNKVLQAAGRVIRTVDDIGVVALLDERFLQYSYRRMFPREWESFQVVSVNTVGKRTERFWDSWL